MSKEAMKLALEALKRMQRYGNTFGYRSHEQNPFEQVCEAITSLETALAKPDFWEGYVPEPVKPAQQEPVAFFVDDDLYYPEEIDWESLKEQGHTVAPLYTSPPAQRTPLTDEEIDRMYVSCKYGSVRELARAIEAELKEKNT